MRDFGKVAPTFWIRGTGKSLRGDHLAQAVALYLMSAPGANMIGLYYLPTQTIAHDLGSPLEGALKALRRLSEGGNRGFLVYSEGSETVFVRTMARRQLGLADGECLKPKDNRVAGVVRLMRECSDPALLQAFWEEYHLTLCLPDPWWEASPSEAPPKPLRSPSEAPSKPGDRREETETEREILQADLPALGLPPTTKPKPSKEKPASPDPATTPGYSEVVQAYFEAFEKARGTKPPFQARDGKAVKDLLAAVGGDVQRAIACIQNAYTDPFWRDKATISSIASDPARTASKALPMQHNGRQPPMAVQPGGTLYPGIDIEELKRRQAERKAATNG